MNSAIIVAGGKGSRINNSTPKQYITINGKEILSYSVTTFLNHPKINEVIIVCNKEWIKHVNEKYNKCKIVAGGKIRKNSVYNGLVSLSDDTQNVLIHDAARPFISKKIISNCLSALEHAKGSAPIINLTNSIIKYDSHCGEFLDRSLCRLVQTPQCFQKQFILDIFQSNIDGTDEIGMALKKYPNETLKFLTGDITNFKITTELDLVLAKKIITSIKNND